MTILEADRNSPEPSRQAREPKPPAQRVIADLGDPQLGPTVLCVGGIHGNEPAGVAALERVAARLAELDIALRGRWLALAGNLEALRQGCRFVDVDLNRLWTGEQLRRVRVASEGELIVEETEARELDVSIGDALARAGELFFLDLHTTSGNGPAFIVLDDTLPNRRFALGLAAPIVLGIEEELPGTLANYLSSRGVVTVGFEGGQHDDPASVDRSEAAIWLALETTGLLDGAGAAEVARARRELSPRQGHLPRVVEVRYRHAIESPDEFAMLSGHAGFEKVAAGAVIARDRDGDVHSPESGLLLMPLYQRQGEDGFFITRPVAMAWLRLSTLLRRLRLDRVAHWLPGVRRHSELPGAFIVDRHVARFLALELFHLLGFRRRERLGDRLVVSRRRDLS